MRHAIRLPNGKAVTLSAYARVWRMLRECDPAREFAGWDYFSERADSILRDIRAGLADRINRHIPGFGAGRKWDSGWQGWASRTAREVNTPHLRVYATGIPAELRGRLAHRLATDLA